MLHRKESPLPIREYAPPRDGVGAVGVIALAVVTYLAMFAAGALLAKVWR